MNKISKKDWAMIIILIVNLVFITIPYTLKNMVIRQDIDNTKAASVPIKTESDPVENYEKFNQILKKNKIKVSSKSADISDNLLKVDISCEADVFEICLLTFDLQKDLSEVYVDSADINKDKSTNISYIIR